MKIADVENLSFADLKHRRAELEEQVKDDPTLAARYVKARTDAAKRDEKLAEQGKTIKLLQSALDEQKAARTASDKALLVAEQKATNLGANFAEASKQLTAANKRGDRLKALADKNAGAVSSAYKVLAEAMHAQAASEADEIAGS